MAGDTQLLLENDLASTSKRTVAYFYDDDVGAYAFNLVHPMKPHRIKMAHNLITNYGLDKHMDVIRPDRCTPHEMTRFHTDEYIDMLNRVTPETFDEMTGHGSRFLIGEDCPPFEGLFEFCSISAGGSLSAARRLIAAKADIAVNWAGGLHHAKKREASGFCYINDIVLAILELLRYHSRVLYIDIDVHHGDGVEEAFYTTDRVMTASFHKFGDFFPGTGAEGDKGKGRGKGYAVNFPLKDGIDDESYRSVFRPVMQHIMDWYRPGAIILQCGADSLASDKLGSFNLSMSGHASCVAFMRTFNIPLIILGGGGYTIRNVARTWAYETGVACGVEMSRELPFNEYLEYFGPEFKLDVPENNMDNANSREYLDKTTASIIDGLRNLPFAPSAQLQPVGLDLPSPSDSSDDDLSDLDLPSGGGSDLDARLSERIRATARAARARGGGYEAEYASEDEEPESNARRKRRLGGSYIHGMGRERRERLRERQARAALGAQMEEEECGYAHGYGGAGDVHMHGMGEEEVARPRKRTFFKGSRLDVRALLKAPDPALGRLGLAGLGAGAAAGLNGNGVGGGYAESEMGGTANGGNGTVREWAE
ncbi:hypothetical protein JCM10207_004638 [Rhodosporidiobolus poonsookiae]